MRSSKILNIVSIFIGLFLVSACGATMVGGTPSEGGAMTEGATHSADETNHTLTPNHENDPPVPGSSPATGSVTGGPSMPIAIASTHLTGGEVPGIQATDPSVPAGFAKASRMRVHVANLSGQADASENEAGPNDPCVDASGQILPQIFSPGERPFVFFRQDSSNPGTGLGPLGVETDDCGRRYITYVPEIQDNYNPLDPARSGCKGSAEVWATFKTSEGQILETDHQTVACTMEGGIFSLTLKFPPSEEIVMPVLRIIPQKIVKTIDPLVLKSFLPAPQ